MPISFFYKKEKSSFLGTIFRPVATVSFQNAKTGVLKPITMLVDTGADYTLLPRFLAFSLGISLIKETVFFYDKELLVRLGSWEKKIPLGFLDTDFIPPLLGRYHFFETFRTMFDNQKLTFLKSLT